MVCSNKKLLSYCELNKLINESKCILNDDILDYFESLLSLDSSVLYNDDFNNVSIKYLKQLELFKDLVLYNIYHRSLKLIDDDENKYKVFDNTENCLNIGICIDDINFNILSFDYGKTIPNLYFYNNNSSNTFNTDDNLIKYCEHDYLLSCERKQILTRFLCQNNLKFSDFCDINSSSRNKQKIKEYGFANVIIK